MEDVKDQILDAIRFIVDNAARTSAGYDLGGIEMDEYDQMSYLIQQYPEPFSQFGITGEIDIQDGTNWIIYNGIKVYT